MKLFKHFGENKNCYPTQPTIANDLGICQGTVSNAINELINKGFISATHTPLGNYIYEITSMEDNPFILLNEAKLFFLKNVKLVGIKKDRILQKLRDSVKNVLSDTVVESYVQQINDNADSHTKILKEFTTMLLTSVKNDLYLDATINLDGALDDSDELISLSDLIEDEEYMKVVRSDVNALFSDEIKEDIEDYIDKLNVLHFIEFFKITYYRKFDCEYIGNKLKDLSAMAKVYDKFEDNKCTLCHHIDLFLCSDTFHVKTIETFSNSKIQSMIAFEMRNGFAAFDYEAVNFNRNFRRNHTGKAM